MRKRNLAFLAVGLGFAAVVVLPLRAIKERGYSSKEVTLPVGSFSASVDGAYHSLAVPFWFDGLQTDAPYRLRFFFHPKTSVTPQLVVTRVTITGAGVSHPLAVRAEGGGWDRDRSGQPVFIAAFLDVPLTSPEAVAEVELSLDGRPVSARLSLVQSTSTKIVHSGVEAIMGI
jgi:hypothetical protein